MVVGTSCPERTGEHRAWSRRLGLVFVCAQLLSGGLWFWFSLDDPFALRATGFGILSLGFCALSVACLSISTLWLRSTPVAESAALLTLSLLAVPVVLQEGIWLAKRWERKDAQLLGESVYRIRTLSDAIGQCQARMGALPDTAQELWSALGSVPGRSAWDTIIEYRKVDEHRYVLWTRSPPGGAGRDEHVVQFDSGYSERGVVTKRYLEVPWRGPNVETNVETGT